MPAFSFIVRSREQFSFSDFLRIPTYLPMSCRELLITFIHQIPEHIFPEPMLDAHLIRYEQERYDRRCALDLVFYIWNCKEGKKVYKAFLLGILKSCIFSIISNISTTLVHFNTNISDSDIVKWTSTNFLTQLRPGLLQKFASARNSSVWPFGFLLSASKLRFTIRTLFTNIVDLSRGSRNEQIVLWRLQTRLLWVNAACVPASERFAQSSPRRNTACAHHSCYLNLNLARWGEYWNIFNCNIGINFKIYKCFIQFLALRWFYIPIINCTPFVVFCRFVLAEALVSA